MLDARQLIERLHLEPLPIEGGYFRQTYRGAGTAIYYLLTSEPDCFSALHCLPKDEVYHFYLGDPVRLLLLHPDGVSEEITLGQDLVRGEQLQLVVPRGVWQGARLDPGGRFALLGTTMAPGFEEGDLVLGRAADLMERYPDRAAAIRHLTRETS
jgi:predicted cupin superfamily sugar epimerase